MADVMPPVPDPTVWRRIGAVPPARIAFASRSLLGALEAGCADAAGTVALAGNDGSIGRADLIGRVRRVAAHVQRRIPPGRVVAALLPQSPDGVAALLGCAAAGRICVVLNTADPAERQRLILDNAGAAALVFDDATIAPPDGIPAIALSDALADAGDPVPVPHDPDAPCMVHYTSGSTGRPKGIVLSAYAILTRVHMGITLQSLRPADRFLVATSISDASSCAAVLAAITSGATKLVVSLPREGVGGMLRLAAREQVTVLSGTAALLRALRNLAGAAEAIAGVRLLRVGGTGLPSDDLAIWRAMLPPGCEISHAYASTEALLVSDWRIPPDHVPQGATLGTGHMLPGIEHALLDSDGRPVPEGAPGEMLLRGRQIALGEWQDGGVVAGRMHPDPAQPGSRIFRTGDLLRFDADGVLHFVGRADRQVKVNGVRVELAEIEAVLCAEAGVCDAAVVQAADGMLHGFVAAEADATLRRRLNRRLRAALPPAMRPGRITVLPSLPLLPSAKPDLEALRRLADG